jgi:predicted nucleic acid-binding protein
MNRYFADTFYYVALLNPTDSYHHRAEEMAKNLHGHIWTTEAVLLEFANAFSHPGLRMIAAEAIRKLRNSVAVTVVPILPDFFERGLALYEQRPDKEWSLTDCLSFVVMQDSDIMDALTGDLNFEQAGFRVLLREAKDPPEN